MIYYTRMWRVYKVFLLYQDYMEQQKKSIEKELEIDSSDPNFFEPD